MVLMQQASPKPIDVVVVVGQEGNRKLPYKKSTFLEKLRALLLAFAMLEIEYVTQFKIDTERNGSEPMLKQGVVEPRKHCH